MSLEPINLFSHRIDPRGVLGVLREFGEVRVEGPEDDWETAELTLKKKWLRGAQVLQLGHDAEYYDGEGWPRQVMGMRGYFSQFPDSPRKPDVMQAIGAFRFSLSVPTDDLDIESDDDRLAVVYAVCEHLDGVIFTPSALRDAQGRVLIGADGECDPNAVLPQARASSLPTLDDTEDSVDLSGDDEPLEVPVPPTPERVARRALVLTAVAARATLELDAPEMETPDVHRERLLKWIDELGIGDELEPDEWEVLQRPVGRLEQQSFVNAMWRVEGLCVLAWALQRYDLPPDDELVTPPELYQSMGLFKADEAREILEQPNLRPTEELDEMAIHLLMLHWRVRDFSLRPQPMDFVAFSKKSWLGEFDISRFRIIDNDLAIGDTAIADASPDEVQRVQSLAMERHLAINWLMGDADLYSDTDTST